MGILRTEGKSYSEAFVAGVNAFVGDVRAGRRPLPLEFRIAGTLPDLWSTDDIVRVRSHGLTRNVASEVKRSLVACAAGLDADRLRVRLQPAWKTTIPDGLDPCVVPKDVLAAYDLATRPVSFARLGQKSAAIHDPDKFLAQADPNSRHYRFQQLGGGAIEDCDRAADPCQRPAPRAQCAVVALYRAS